jgi:hypothetical protein
MIHLNDILDQPRKVKHSLDGKVFIASAIKDSFGVIAIAAWNMTDKPIPRGKHMIHSAAVREDWFSHLEIIQ